MTIERYVINVPDVVLDDLDDRLARTRWPANLLWKPAHANVPQVATPTAIAIAPADAVYMPRSWMQSFYNLKQLTFMESGGHFAAMEEPDAVVADMRKFFQGLRTTQNNR